MRATRARIPEERPWYVPCVRAGSPLMDLHPMLRAAWAFAVASSALLVQASCARAIDDDYHEPVLIGPDAGMQILNVCVQTECPAPFATCPGVAAPCGVDLRSDVEHCGACDTPCPGRTKSTHGSYVCSEAQCRIACDEMFADCNDSPADGCETATADDPDNCGACGNKCKDGVLCWKGACGCPSGFTQCGNDCKRLDSDVDNCGACGSLCRAPKDPADPRWRCGPKITPENAEWSCASGACNLMCRTGFGDCNQDFCGDGCEIDLRFDPKNCGVCGNACAPGQFCNFGTCLCPEGLTACRGECVDIDKDPLNCGLCGHKCPGPAATWPGQTSNGSPTCEGGLCGYVCYPGFADCDGRLGNGCEAKLASDQRNCGQCGTACDVAGGQPCVEGKCLTKACERGPLR